MCGAFFIRSPFLLRGSLSLHSTGSYPCSAALAVSPVIWPRKYSQWDSSTQSESPSTYIECWSNGLSRVLWGISLAVRLERMHHCLTLRRHGGSIWIIMTYWRNSHGSIWRSIGGPLAPRRLRSRGDAATWRQERDPRSQGRSAGRDRGWCQGFGISQGKQAHQIHSHGYSFLSVVTL